LVRRGCTLSELSIQRLAEEVTLPPDDSGRPLRQFAAAECVLDSMRPIRFLPPDCLVEVSARTIHGRMLLRPDPVTCDAILGVLGRAQAFYRIRIVAFAFLSNHYHLLLLPDSSRQLADFMGYLASNVAREVGRLHDWRETFWSRRYRAIPVSDEDAAQLARLRYVLAHGVKEGLVAKVRDWPGPTSSLALLEGARIQGTWFDRTTEYRARRKGNECSREHFSSTETVTLTPIPCWAGWSVARRQQAVGQLLEAIERDAEIARQGRQPLGREAILRQAPHERTASSKRSRAPAFHVATRAAWRVLREAYRIFVNAFWRASELFRAGDRLVEFPPGSFPPALPYVPISSG
jgi:REP element-mobilizing transposase RayT